MKESIIDNTKNVCVRFFGVLEEYVGKSPIEIPLNAGKTLSELLADLEKQYPRIFKTHILVALNQELSTDKHIALSAGDEIALMPPFTGG